MVKKVNKKMDTEEIEKIRNIMGVDEANKDNYTYVEGVGLAWETGKPDLKRMAQMLSDAYFKQFDGGFNDHELDTIGRKLFLAKFCGDDNKAADYFKQIEEKVKIKKSQILDKSE
ncbi:hypothetical protein [Peribacillus sp. R9-11]|uniref:hypothetical protein n=1 Tax=Peribacillus sp. R9-11 TaxID=3073271 RepID=UPI0028684A0A|nr:hypothetical protein [Peribacillus sp. R9-11]WMX58111.1 hypothetical protein RE409_13305 [Peribacillus sp. R9-11]